jgi:hypothetical protein
MITRPPITRDGAQHEAHSELARPIYHRGGEPLAVRAVRGFGHLLDRILGAAFKHAPTGNHGALALVGLVLVVAAAIVVWRVGVPRRAARVGAVLSPSRAMSAADHRGLAERAADDGDVHTAVVERMRAVARELEERGVLDQRPGRTATELTDQAAIQLPGDAAALRAAARAFNEVAYGDATATPAHLASVVAADDLVRQTRRTLVEVT